jgi:hypothetical protein
VFASVVGMQGGAVGRQEVLETVERVRSLCARLDPAAIPLSEVPVVFDLAVELEKLGAGAVVRMTARYEQAGAWRGNGAKSAEDDIARKTGSSTSNARRNLGTSKRLGLHPETDAAVKRGELSSEQAAEVTLGAEASPADEEKLLESARKDRLHELKRKSAEARARADQDREATRRRLHRMRCLRRWNDAEGMGNLLLRLPADEMAEVDAALKRPIDQRFADARHAGRFEPPEAYGADVVRERLLGTSGSEGAATKPNQAVRPDKKVIALIDVEALNRGRVEGDETCEIAGVGPVSVSAVRRLMSDAFLSIVFTKGDDILNVTHLGRQVTARQRTALEARGARCELCGSTHLLDIDHNEGWALVYETKLENLFWECWHCHDVKTRHDLRVTGPPGARTFVHRDGTPWRGPAGGDPAATEAARDGPVQDHLFTTAS